MEKTHYRICAFADDNFNKIYYDDFETCMNKVNQLVEKYHKKNYKIEFNTIQFSENLFCVFVDKIIKNGSTVISNLIILYESQFDCLKVSCKPKNKVFIDI